MRRGEASGGGGVHDRARHRYKATSRTKRDGHKPRQQPCAAAPLPSTGRLSADAPVPRAGFSRVPCTESPGGRLSAERQRGPEHPSRRPPQRRAEAAPQTTTLLVRPKYQRGCPAATE